MGITRDDAGERSRGGLLRLWVCRGEAADDGG